METDRGAKVFVLLLVNSWTQEKSQCFVAKAVSKYLFQSQGYQCFKDDLYISSVG
jgi:hypothetical protein